jgi:hypothetical protein
VVDPHARIIHRARAESRMICVRDGPLSRGLGHTNCPRRHPLLQGVEYYFWYNPELNAHVPQFTTRL